MKINSAFINCTNLVLAGLLSLLGFSGCGSGSGNDDEVAIPVYACLLAAYTVKGTVVNKENGKPIEGIRVGYSPVEWAIAEYGVMVTAYRPKSYVLTDAKGEFKLTDNSIEPEIQIVDNSKILPVFIDDIDGVNNGLFQSDTLQVDFEDAEHRKPTNWEDGGEYTITVNVEMTEIVKVESEIDTE
jgi:putative lipoprotein (rSAM/lipoprotein system)